MVDEQATRHGVALTASTASSRFTELANALAERDGHVVVLVDEYDKPILGNADNPENLPAILKKLKDFYSVIKGTEGRQRFALLTGVSKFSHVSIFSDLNNLTDISMNADYATLFGYTQEELERNFAPYIDRLAETTKMDREALLDKIRDWYNGYRFHQTAPTVYNPVSVMSMFMNREFKNYWFATGTPSMLINLLKRGTMSVSDMESVELPEVAFAAYDVENMAVEPLLFQTGYVTIKGFDPEWNTYTLGYPNREVRDAFIQYLADAF